MKPKQPVTFKETFEKYRGVVAAIAVTALVSGWVAHTIAKDAEEKADRAIKALDAVAATQLQLAETQNLLAQDVARQRGTVEGVLAGLDLTPKRLELYLRLPRTPALMTTDSSKVVCGQTWLYATEDVDTIMIFTLDDSCKVGAFLVHPRQNHGP